MTLSETERQKLERKHVMNTLALATEGELTDAWDALDFKPGTKNVRGPETGLVMVRGRTGGAGQQFNLGEVAVSRATILLENGIAGHAHVLGNHPEKARLAAVFDALAQTETHKPVVDRLLTAIETRVNKQHLKQAQETAATGVDFFTLVRGED